MSQCSAGKELRYRGTDQKGIGQALWHALSFLIPKGGLLCK